MTAKTIPALFLCAVAVAALPLHAQDAPVPGSAKVQGHPITEVAHFQNYQATGIAVSGTGQLYACFPRWSNDYKYAVAAVGQDSSLSPFPDEQWNSWQDKDPDVAGKWVCVQSITVDDTGALWVLDTGNPGMTGTLAGGPKLVKFDLTTKKATQTIPFGADICPAKSYLNDVRIDTGRQIAYLTESGIGSIIVVDLKSGNARRLLVEDKSTLGDKHVDLTIDGKEVMTAEKQKPSFNADSLALSPDNAYLYFQPILSAKLYRIATDKLRDDRLSKNDLSKAVETVGESFPMDGLWMAKDGYLYLSDLRSDAIQRRKVPDGKVEMVAADPRIEWPDSFAQGPDGAIYFSCSHIEQMPRFNGGKSARTEPYAIFKVQP
jgi:sugar lactone lactonase YvrE